MRSLNLPVSRRAFLVGMAVLAAPVVSGCGASLMPATPTRTPSRSAAQPTDKPIVVGGTLSLTSASEPIGKMMRQGYELWAEHLNARGGLLGRKIVPLLLDDQFDPATSAKLYEQLIKQDQVDLLVGPSSTPNVLAASEVTERNGFPMLVAGTSGNQIWERGFRYVFGFSSPAATYGHGALELAKGKGYKTVAFVHEDTPLAREVIAGAEAKAAELGLTVVLKRAYPAKTKEFAELVATLKTATPDVVIGGTSLLDSAALVREAKDANFAPKLFFLTNGPAQPAFYQELGVLAENVMGHTEWEPVVKAPGVDTFVKAYRDQHYEMPSYHAAGAYAAGQVLEAVVRKVGNLDRERLRDGFARVVADTVFGQYLVDRSGTQFAKPNFVIQWRNADRVVVWPESYTDAQPKLPFAWK